MSALADTLSAGEVAELVHQFEVSCGRTSLILAAHAAVAHRLRPEIVALIRTNFFPSPHRFQASFDADVLFGSLCRYQGDGFFEMQREVKDFLVDVLDRIVPQSNAGRFRSQDVARLIRHYLRHVDGSAEYATPRYDQFRHENLWRTIAIDDPLAARDHICGHAKYRNAVARNDLAGAPRGAGIVSITGPVMGLFGSDLAYLEVQDLIADGEVEDAVARLKIMVDAGTEFHAEPDLSVPGLLREQESFLMRRRNMAGDDGDRVNAATRLSPVAKKTVLSNDLKVDPNRVRLIDSALTQAVMAGSQNEFNVALGDPSRAMDQLDRYGLSALHHAVRLGRADMAMALIEAGADINVLSAYDANPLFYAGEHGLVALAEELLARGADLSQKTAKRNTPLMAAAFYGHRALVDLYLRQHMDVDLVNARNDEGFTALYGALSVGDVVIYDALIAAGANPPAPRAGGYTDLHAATAGKSADLVSHVIRAGFTIDPLTADGWSPLHIACSNTPSLAVVRLLLECGADPYRETSHGWTPLRLAANWNNLEIFKHLHAIGTPLTDSLPFDAAMNGAHDVLEYLMVDLGMPVTGSLLVDSIVGSGKPDAVIYMLDRPDVFGAHRDGVFAKAVEFGKGDIIRMYHDKGWSLPPPVENPGKTAEDPPIITNLWINSIRKMPLEWRDTMTALLDWPEAREMVRDLIFAKSVEAGKASTLRVFHDRGWPIPAPPNQENIKTASTQKAALRGWIGVLEGAKSGWKDTAEVLLKWPEFRAEFGDRLFEKAIEKGYIDVFNLYKRNGWPIPEKPTSKPGWAWVIGKDVKNRDELMVDLLNRPGAVIQSEAGERLSVIAATAGLLKTLALVIARGEDLNEPDSTQATPLSAAVTAQEWRAMDILLAAGADPNAPAGRMHRPAFFGTQGDALRTMINNGADFSARGADGCNWLLTNLGSEDSLHLVAWAKSKGIDLDESDAAGQTALHRAAELGLSEVAEVLVKEGAALNPRTIAGLTPLLLALARGREAVADVLLKAGADPAITTLGRMGLLHIAAEQNLPNLVERYWDTLDGPTAMSVTPSRTVLQSAVEARATVVIERLIKLGVDLNRAAGGTQPPVWMALSQKNYEIVEMLFKAGASKLATDPISGSSLMLEVVQQRSTRALALTGVSSELERLYTLLHPIGQAPAKAAASDTKPQPAPAKPTTAPLSVPMRPLTGAANPAPPVRSSAVFLAERTQPEGVGWNPLSGGRLGTSKRALDDLGGDYGASPITEYASHELSFYPGMELVRLRSNRWQGRPSAIFMLDLPGKFLWFDGTAVPILQANSRVPLRITRENVLEYLRFYCFFVRGDDGPFYIAEDLNDPSLMPLREAYPKLVEGMIAAPNFVHEANGTFRGSATVFYGATLFNSMFVVSPEGNVEMRGDEPLAGNLSVRLDLAIR